jgi:ligand-binding SRPBCC domain-containing protein
MCIHANPHYVTINESVIVNAPVDKVWARVGKFCAITEWMNSPEWAVVRKNSIRRTEITEK